MLSLQANRRKGAARDAELKEGAAILFPEA
jgi:hypothetical protein